MNPYTNHQVQQFPPSLRSCPVCSFQQESCYSHCGYCGTALNKQCARCYQFLPVFFRFCGFCGVPLPAAQSGAPTAPPAYHMPIYPPPPGPQGYAAYPHAPMAYPNVAPAAEQGTAQQPAYPPEWTPATAPQTPVYQSGPVQSGPVQGGPAPQATSDVQPAPMPPSAAPQPPQQPVDTPSAALPDSQPAPQPETPATQAPANLLPGQVAQPVVQQSAIARVSERRPVAVLFCDVCGFTAMSEKLDPEEVSNIIQPLFQECNQAINKYGGVIEKFIGDALMALFGVPMTHEDDPERAAMAALEMRTIIQRFGADLEKRMGFSINMRIGLNVGMVVAGSVQSGPDGAKNHQVLGDAINTAARMEQNALPGNILVTEEMYHLLKDSFELRVGKLIEAKGKKLPLQAYDLVGIRHLRQRSRGVHAQHETPLIGREEVLNQLHDFVENQLQSPQPVTVLLSGESGLGKTRLANELHQQIRPQLSESRLLLGNATSYSHKFSYFMLQNLVRSLLEVDETVPHAEVQKRIQTFVETHNLANASMNSNLLEYLLYPHLEIPQLKLMTPERLQQQIFRAISDVMLQLAQKQPLYLLIDDLQWCDPLSLQWLEFFTGKARQQQLSVVLVATSRLEKVPDAEGLIWHHHKNLEPLSHENSLKLINSILGRGPVTDLPVALQPLGKAILERAAGNPYYLEEVLKNLLQDGFLVEQEGEWKLTCSLKELPLPNSVQRLIMSRFDRLPDHHRHLLQTLSAVGDTITWDLLQQLVELPDLEAEMHSLTQTGFIRANTCRHGKEYVFHQTLAREVIYNTMVNRRKSGIHQQIGEKLEKMHMSDPSQVLDLLAFHFSRTAELPKAVRYLNLSAEQAARLYANQQASDQYEDILELLNKLPVDELIGVDLHNRQWLKASRLYHHVLQKQCELMLLMGAYDDVLKRVEEAFERELSPLEKARFLYCRGRVLEKRSQFKEAHAEFAAALELLEQTEPKERARLLNAMGWVSRWMSAFDDALASCGQALQLLADHPDMEQLAYSHNVMGVVHFYQHHWEEALEHYQQSLKIQEQIQDIWGHANSLSNIGNVYFMTNRWLDAIEAFQKSLELRQQLGDIEGIATSCNNLGHAFQELGTYDAAEDYIQQALSHYRQIGHTIGEAVASCNLGSLAFRQRQFDLALERLNKGVEMLEARQMESMLAEVYNHRLQIYLEQQNWQLAAETLERDSTRIEQYGDPLQKGRLARLQGYYCLKQDQLQDADTHFQQALELLQNSDHRNECRLLYQHLGELHRLQGSEQASYWHQLEESLA